MFDFSFNNLFDCGAKLMEYGLMGILYIFQSLMNTLLNFEVANGGSVGLIILSVIILSFVLSKFSVSGSRKESDTDG